ncbi:hypothetical protein G4B88_005272 [Cannabis sativa]|uniref:Pectinesterase n=1 Tax=Cannabis sativa TaxID=3483 RepID=A0A7J6HAH8_CANSA|nr:hypothetical protein G4B88_005272 [Cannabis sativa]
MFDNYKTISEGVAAAAKLGGGGNKRVVVYMKFGVYNERNNYWQKIFYLRRLSPVSKASTTKLEVFAQLGQNAKKMYRRPILSSRQGKL